MSWGWRSCTCCNAKSVNYISSCVQGCNYSVTIKCNYKEASEEPLAMQESCRSLELARLTQAFAQPPRSRVCLSAVLLRGLCRKDVGHPGPLLSWQLLYSKGCCCLWQSHKCTQMCISPLEEQLGRARSVPVTPLGDSISAMRTKQMVLHSGDH